MIKFKHKIFIFQIIFLLIFTSVFVTLPIKSDAVTSDYSVEVQIRKLERQIEKLKVILLNLQINLQKTQAPKKTTQTTPVSTQTKSKVDSVASKALPPGIIPFGGRIVTVMYCGCSANLLVTQIPAAGPAMMIYQPPLSKLYSYFNLSPVTPPGTWILGDILGVAPCIQGIPPFCALLGTYPLIKIVGTSH